jgi:hypothetical protein
MGLQNVQNKQGDVSCASCLFFNNQPSHIERSVPGLSVMGSAHSSVVSLDGLCSKHDRYLSAHYSCALHELKAG